MEMITNVKPTAKERCSHCGAEFKKPEYDFMTGYAVRADGSKICYDCCGSFDRAYMTRTGRNTLYLSDDMTVSNWPGTLKIKVHSYTEGKHNIAGKRIDVWFAFEDYIWHGVQYGRDTQIVHCKRTKKKAIFTKFFRDESRLADT